MPRNGLGTYSLPAGQPVVSGTTISSSTFNTLTSDLATALTQSLCIDGQAVPTANLGMGGFKITNAAVGTATTDVATLQNFASPPAIGSTTPAAGSFTTLNASSTVTGTKHISTASGNSNVLEGTADGGIATVLVTSADSASGTSAYSDVRLRRARGTVAAPTAISAGDLSGLVRFYGYNGSTYAETASIRVLSETAFTTAPNNQSYMAFYTCPTPGNAANSEAVRITSVGNVGIGTTAPAGALHVRDATNRTDATAQFTISGNGYNTAHFLDATGYAIQTNSASRTIRMIANTNGVSLAVGATAWAAISDETQKDIIEPISNATEKVSGLRTVIGKYKTDAPSVRRSFLIAQDVQAVLPEAVDTDSDGILNLRYSDVVPLLAAAIKEQQATIVALEARLSALEPA